MSKRNTVIQGQTRKIIYNVTQYMLKEKEEGVKNVNAAQARAAEATGTSQRTIRRILAASKSVSDLETAFRTPGKVRPRTKPITHLDDFDQGVIRRCIHNFHKNEKEVPSLKMLLAKLKKEINFCGSKTSLSTIIKQIGFKGRKTAANRKVLIEKTDIRLKRIQYLQKIKQYRDEGRAIVYTGETYVNSKDSPFSKTQRIKIVHAGSDRGFVPNALLTFESGLKTGTNRDDMNYTDYEDWVRTKLLPNLPPNSVVVIDNAPHHNKLLNTAPISIDKKEKMVQWLAQKGIPFDNDMLKPELYDLIKKNKDVNKIYVIDTIIENNNHLVFRLPPYHPDLNAIEMALMTIKNYVDAQNVEWEATRIMNFVKEIVDIIGQAEWVAMCKQVIEVEEAYRENDYAIDDMTEQVTMSMSETESEGDSDDSLSCDDMPSMSDSKQDGSLKDQSPPLDSVSAVYSDSE